MTRFLQVLLTLGLLSFVVGTALAFAHTTFLLAPQGYWRGAMGFWMLVVATRLTYLEKK